MYDLNPSSLQCSPIPRKTSSIVRHAYPVDGGYFATNRRFTLPRRSLGMNCNEVIDSIRIRCPPVDLSKPVPTHALITQRTPGTSLALHWTERLQYQECRDNAVESAPSFTDQSMSLGPIFLVGTGRCGSTVIYSLLKDLESIAPRQWRFHPGYDQAVPAVHRPGTAARSR